MRYLNGACAVLLLVLAAGCGDDVAGYDSLALPPAEQARKDVLDVAAIYQPVQIIIEQAVTEPLISAELKSALQLADREAVAALVAYRQSVDQLGPGADGVTERLQAFMVALSRAQALLVDAQTEGVL